MTRMTQFLALAAFLLIAGIFSLLTLIFTDDGKEKKNIVPSVGFILLGSPDEAGWNRQNAAGVTKAAAEVGIKLNDFYGIAPGSVESEAILKQFASSGHDFIIACSASYFSDIEKIRKDFPKTYFALPRLEYGDEQCIPYFLRLYQGEYLAGILAGMRTKSNIIGYVAPIKNPEICRAVNAFAIGARQMSPEARVIVYWVGAWSAPEEESLGAERLVKSGADILNSHQDGQAVQKFADENGVEFFGYLEPYDSQNCVGTISCRWDSVYQAMITDYIRGKFRPVYWFGMNENAVDFSVFSERVNWVQRRFVEASKQMLRGSGHIFAGKIRDNRGIIRCLEGESLSDAALINMDWFVEGVEFYEPLR